MPTPGRPCRRARCASALGVLARARRVQDHGPGGPCRSGHSARSRGGRAWPAALGARRRGGGSGWRSASPRRRRRGGRRGRRDGGRRSGVGVCGTSVTVSAGPASSTIARITAISASASSTPTTRSGRASRAARRSAVPTAAPQSRHHSCSALRRRAAARAAPLDRGRRRRRLDGAHGRRSEATGSPRSVVGASRGGLAVARARRAAARRRAAPWSAPCTPRSAARRARRVGSSAGAGCGGGGVGGGGLAAAARVGARGCSRVGDRAVRGLVGALAGAVAQRGAAVRSSSARREPCSSPQAGQVPPMPGSRTTVPAAAGRRGAPRARAARRRRGEAPGLGLDDVAVAAVRRRPRRGGPRRRSRRGRAAAPRARRQVADPAAHGAAAGAVADGRLEAVGVEPGGQVAAAAPRAPPRARAPPRTGRDLPRGRRRWRRPARRPPAFRAGSRRRSRRVCVSGVATGRSWAAGRVAGSAPTVEYRLAPFRASASSASRHASTTRAAIAVGREQLGAARGPSTRGSAASRCGRSAARHASRSHGAQSAPSMPSQRDRVDPDRRAERGHAAGERLDHRQPEALGLRRDEHGVGGVDPVRDLVGRDAAHRQQRHVAGRLLRAVEALQRPRGVVREQQVGPVGVQAEALARLAARDRAEAARGRCRRAAPRRAASSPRRGGSR